MIFKSYLLEKDKNFLSNKSFFLFYGENNGLKKDFKDEIIANNKSKEILNFYQEEIIKKNDLLFSEIENKSLFEKEKIIFINEANDKVFEIIQKIIEKVDKEKIIIFSNILEKKSKLRNFAEKSKDLIVVPCYQDNEITIKNIIREKLKGLEGLSSQIVNIIFSNVGLDRMKMNNEVEKIKVCFNNEKLEQEKIEDLLNLRTNEDFNFLKDEALKGNKKKTNKLLSDTVFENENYIFYLNIINQRVKKLNEIDNLKKNDDNLEYVISSIKPPIFWKDKINILEQSKRWRKEKLKIALEKIYKTEIDLKSSISIRKDLILKKLILDLCIEADAT